MRRCIQRFTFRKAEILNKVRFCGRKSDFWFTINYLINARGRLLNFEGRRENFKKTRRVY